MAEEDLLVASQTEIEAVQVVTPASSATGNATSYTSAFSSGIRPPAALAAPPSIPRLFEGSGLRRPSKIPRLAKKQLSIASTAGENQAVESQASFSSKRTAFTTAPSSAVSVASAVSSRETTPFSSPKPASRLREPKQVHGWKRPRVETTGKTIASVAERLRQQQQLEQHSEDLSVATTHEDASGRDEEYESMPNSQSMASVAEEEEDKPNLDQKLIVARALRQDLLRDRARLRFKISAIKDAVETSYGMLARMEHAVVAVTAQCAETDGDPGKRDAKLRVAERILAIITAKKTDQYGEKVIKEKSEVGETGHEATSSGSIPPAKALTDPPQEEEVEEH